MKNNKIIVVFIILFIIIVLGGGLVLKKVKMDKEELENYNEYIPQEEISEEQTRQTIVSLFFKSKDTNNLIPEARMIDIKEIINNPCERLIELLIEGPKNEKEEKIIPENTKLNNTHMEGDCVVLDFSEDFLNFDKSIENEKQNLIMSIVNTLTQLTEVNRVKILIEGNDSEEFNEVYSVK